MNPRLWFFVFLGIAASAQLAFIHHSGWDYAWRFWQLDARTPHFSDLRVVTGAGDSIDRGFDPREENPGAPFGQRFNYPSLWLQPAKFGVRNADTTAVGLVMLAGYLVALWWISAGASRLSAALLGALVFSPAALLAIERGSTDLSVVFCLAFAGYFAARRPRGAFVAVLIGFWLKLFPLAGIVVFLREPRRRAIRFLLLAAGVVAVFCLLNFRELVDIAYKTEKGPHTSYGWAVLSLHVGSQGGAAWVKPLYIAGLVLALVSATAATWTARHAPEATDSHALDFFRIGAAVYAGTFLLGANWDYRLIFGLFLIPQLVEWSTGADVGLRRWSRIVLSALFVSAWSLAIKGWAEPFYMTQVAARAAEEIAKWTLFIGCVHLFARVLPYWLKPTPPSSE